MKNPKIGLSAVLILAANDAWLSSLNQMLLFKGPGSFNKNFKIGANVDESETYQDPPPLPLDSAFKQVFS